MSQIQMRADAYATLDPTAWAELVADYNLPVQLGEPAVQTIDGVDWCIWDDPRITEDQAIVVALEVANG